MCKRDLNVEHDCCSWCHSLEHMVQLLLLLLFEEVSRLDFKLTDLLSNSQCEEALVLLQFSVNST